MATRVSDWHPYADRWYRDPLTCVGCGAIKPPRGYPTGWWKRFTPQTRTQAMCPACWAAKHPC